MAKLMKTKGLRFRPHAGCFVWDPENRISVPSPFPNRVYFILNLGRFESIFGSLEAVEADLVWIPTETQAREIIRNLGGDPEIMASGTRELYSTILGRIDPS
jgi:hypothetical protein